MENKLDARVKPAHDALNVVGGGNGIEMPAIIVGAHGGSVLHGSSTLQG
ncbi:hypothetical protein JQ557_06925 [Bradyrhizobium sp. U87765 SZCCT0131]|nr:MULTISPECIES: hypothetical protein [unclassified Bradyrhizobium]MBR1217715.1 hypothetical protein [Bradyrhizobium sp. U87765 SZCCT0131]MBR1261339.1 hypothetical protein [Bradyrhizobium sp. U87765 SZCCT0134]MBR1303213.1 hypothetical protein [Bradyrhizobium sp. U87765 SZCCT0110]MBR1318819.1 hypothetical protein [Bradyrhizobium sp. U87765 SZCCT0109]MBR1347144.1 hypothetical protein [Bradyrhizobium sp. U87765 SZCCT0048]